MKKTVLILFMGMIALGFESCQKYEEGPIVSIYSRSSRVINNWKVDNYKVNGTDFTSLVSGYTEVFSKDGGYSYDWSLLSGNGTWKFQNNDNEIKILGINNQSDKVLYIQKLENKQFWYYYMDGSDKKEFHMIQK